MNKVNYKKIEKYMLSCMKSCDIAHDAEHIYRVLYNALEISKEYDVDKDVLIASCLLHDIGRNLELNETGSNHSDEGGKLAYEFLISNGWPKSKANHVKDCIITHTYQLNMLPESIEAKIVFDADKLDLSGAIGIARYIAYSGIVSQQLYSMAESGGLLSVEQDKESSFFKGYHLELKNIDDRLHTPEAKKMFVERKKEHSDIYNRLLNEVTESHHYGYETLELILDK